MAPTPTCEGAQVLRIAVKAGDYVHAVADQGPWEVFLDLTGPGGRQLHVDSLTAESQPNLPAEELYWVADAPGEVRVALSLPSGFQGPCGLRLAEHRPATPADRKRALAEEELAWAHKLRRTHEPESCRAAIPLYESAQHRFMDLGLPRRRTEALYGLGLLQQKCLHNDTATLQAFTRAESLFAGDPAFELKARQILGELRLHQDLAGAVTDDQRALELSRQLGDRAAESLAAGNLGLVLHLSGHFDEAAALFDRSLALWKPEDGLDRKAQVLLNRGHLHRDLGELDAAGERFEEALRLFRQTKDRHNEAVALNALGLLAQDRGTPGEALEPLQAALALRPLGSRGWAVTQTTLGAVYRQLGRLEEARRAYGEALPVFVQLGDSRQQALCLGNLGRLETATGNQEAAVTDFDRALGLFRQLADPSSEAWVLEGKARVLRRRGDLEAARGFMEDAITAIEGHRFRQTSYTTRAVFFATQQGFYDFLIDLLLEMDRKGEALEVSERSLARSLLDGLAVSGMDLRSGGGDPELRARERELEQEIDRLVALQTRLGQSETGAPESSRSIEKDLGRRWDELDRVRSALRAGDPRYASLTQPQPWKAGDIQRRLLDRDTLLLEYRLGERRSLLWAVTPDSLETFVLPGRGEIERAARAGSWTRRSGISADLQLARLGRMLLDPVARLLPGKRLLVVGDGILQSLPFAAMPEPGTGEPLVARHEIVSLPSISVLGVLRQEVARRPRAPKTLWVLADPDFGPGLTLERLLYSGEEAGAILALVPAAERLEVHGRAASRAAVLEGPLRDYRFLHFATHGSFTASDSGGGRLVLAQVDPRGRPESNGFLHLADIYELNLRADLVVLSACQSALGKDVRGEGMMGMTRGFFYAGAERVLVSLWNVNDRASVELMRRFYQEMLQEHLSPAAALRKAQDEIRREERWRSPYYWAGFTLQGEWRGEGPRSESQRRRREMK